MKAVKLTALVAVAMISSTAMANTVTDAVANTTDSVVDGGKTLFKTFTNPAAVSLELGTLGYGANVAWGVNDSVELQAGWAGMNFDVSTDVGGNDSIINWTKVLGDEYDNYEGKLNADVDFSTPYLGVQLRPMKNWLTVGTGVMVPSHEITATLNTTQNSQIVLNGTEHPVNVGDTIVVHAENKNLLAPYLTLGFRPNVTNRFGAFAEVGAAYVGKYDATVTTTSASGADLSSLQADLQKEVKDSSFSWYPIAKVGATYRF